MRCAVLISGQPRNVELCWENINTNLISPNNADVFIHSWIDPKMVGKQYRANWVKPEYAIVQKKNPDEKDDIASGYIPEKLNEKILELYKPKKWLFQEPFQFTYDDSLNTNRVPYLNPQDSLSFFYSMYASNVMKQLHEIENKTTYDVVMRIRFDCVFNQPIELAKYANSTKIFVPNDFFNDLGSSDRWNISNSKLMNKYTEVYLYMQDLVKNNEIYLQNEFIVGYWIQRKNNIVIDRIDLPYYIRRQ